MSRRIKIIRIQSRICIGGPAVHTEILSRHLPDRYRTVLLGGALEPDEHSLFHDIKARGVDIRLIETMRREPRLSDDLESVRKIYRIIKREKPDIVHTHTAKAGATGRLAAHLARVPVIVHTFHGHAFENYFSQTQSRFFVTIEKALAKLTHRIIAISPRQKRDLVDRYRIAPESKVRVVPLGFELERFLRTEKNGALKASLGIPASHRLLGIIGRLVPIKNHAMALRVLKQLSSQEPNVHLCIVGDGESRRDIERMAEELGVRKHVHFLGWVKEIERIYEGLDVLLLTSLNEGTPVAVIEAMASSVPVVATSVGGVPDLLQGDRNGLSCRVNDVDEMAAKVRRLLEDADLASELCRNAKSFAEKNYSYQRLVRDIDELYLELLAKVG